MASPSGLPDLDRPQHLERLLRTLPTALTTILLAGWCAGALSAQSISAGAVVGTVKDTTSQPMASVRVALTDRTSGFTWSMTTENDGRYSFTFLPPGEYDLLAEELGYRPVEVRGVRVSAGDEISLDVRLEAAEPPVMERTIERYTPNALTASAAGPGWTFGTFEMRRLPDDRRDIGSLSRFTTIGDDDGVIEGLPPGLAGLTMDGIGFRSARHPVFGAFDPGTSAFPLMSVSGAVLDPGGVDVEWSDFASGRLSAAGVRGTSTLQSRLFGDWSGTPVTSSKFFRPQDLSGNSFRGGLLVSGPVIRDTAHFVLGFEGQRLQTPLPPTWEATPSDSALLAIAADSFGLDLGPQLAPRLADIKALTGFARFDWQASGRSRLSVFGNGALLDATNAPVGLGRVATLGATAKTHDIAAGATLTSVLSRKFALEFRAGFENSRREYAGNDTALTFLPGGPAAFGTDPALPGQFSRTGVRLGETIHITAGRHRLKLGGGGSFSSINDTYAYDRGGEFAIGSDSLLGVREGGFQQVVGRIPVARYSTYQFGAFIQDRWRGAPGFDFVVGLRFDRERVPASKILLNSAWQAQTAMRNDSIGATHTKLSPRIGLVWDVANQHRWIVRAEGGWYHGVAPEDAFAEAVATANGVDGRRGAGALGRWPATPDSAVAAVTGPSLALLNPSFSAPRTGRALLGVSGSLGGGAALHLAASYRHTDYLIRRHDLNLIQAPTGHDQYGRPVYGTLVQSGSALFVQPGSNRRFDTFDVVTALDQDGYSDYYGISARIEKRVGRFVTFSTGYTYSKTQDNWVGAAGGPDAQVTPFPDSLSGLDWADGRSDFDAPTRVVFGTEINLRSFRLAAFYGFRSGHPFTPGFRDGVDANGDGSWGNDPAYVDDQIAGIGDVIGAWPCLQGQIGRFAERNSCRGPGISRLDLRVVLGPFRLGAPVALVVDGLNLLDAEYAAVDRALYLVDPAGSLTTDPATGVVTVPLVANPNFGKAIRRYGSGRALRFGIRVNYE